MGPEACRRGVAEEQTRAAIVQCMYSQWQVEETTVGAGIA